MDINVDITLGDVEVLSIPSTSSSSVLLTGRARLVGWSVVETSGANPFQVNVTSGDNLVAAFGAPASTATSQWLGDAGISIKGDITLNVVSGEFAGAIYVKHYI